MLKKFFEKFFNANNNNEEVIVKNNVISNNKINGSLVIGGSVVVNGKNSNVSYRNGNNSDLIKGNGKIKEISINIEKFSSIRVDGVLTVNVKIGNERSIKISADENIVEMVEIKNINEKLHVSMKNNISFMTKNPIIITIVEPSLNQVSLFGSGEINILDLNSEKFSAILKGSGDIIISGKSESINLILSGSGDIDAEEVDSKNVEIKLSGSGDITANATVNAKVELSGSGNVKVYGKPQTQKSKISGSGNVKFK